MVSVDECLELRPAVFGELALKNTQPRAATIKFEAKQRHGQMPQNPGREFDPEVEFLSPMYSSL